MCTLVVFKERIVKCKYKPRFLTSLRYSSLLIIAKTLPYRSLRPIMSWLQLLTRQVWRCLATINRSKLQILISKLVIIIWKCDEIYYVRYIVIYVPLSCRSSLLFEALSVSFLAFCVPLTYFDHLKFDIKFHY